VTGASDPDPDADSGSPPESEPESGTAADHCITDGERIAELLASEIDGRERGPLGRVALVDVREGVDPGPDGTFAYGIAVDESGGPEDRLADVSLHDERARLDVRRGLSALPPADDRLRVRPKATRPPGAVVFVESGAAVKPAVDLIAALVRAVEAPDEP